jgi:hypothetical protein
VRCDHPGRDDRQLADPQAGGVVHGVGDGGSGADDPALADPLGPERVDPRV